MEGPSADIRGPEEGLNKHRLIVNTATFDDVLDNKVTSHDDVASAETAPTDNTHTHTSDPYLTRYADRWAKEKEPAKKTTQTRFINVASQECNVGEMHTGDDGKRAVEVIVDFDANPTVLFQLIYSGNKWDEAKLRLETHPEEARVWVARYSTRGSGSTVSTDDVRWKLLPLHLFIALKGNSSSSSANDDNDLVSADFLTSLIQAFPEAVLCRDDQNMIPLHCAIRGLSSLDTVQTLLCADPSSVYMKDNKGRNSIVLAEKVYGHSRRRGDEDVYKKLMAMLASSMRGFKPTQTDTEDYSLEQLQEENIALRNENRELREQAEINEHLLKRLIEKIQEIENYNQIFGVDSNDDMDRRREQILHNLSQEEETSLEQGQVETLDHKTGGNGAYSKRIHRYTSQTPSKSESNTLHLDSPTETEVTEPLSPVFDADDPRETTSFAKMTEDGETSKDSNDVGTNPDSDQESPKKDQSIFRDHKDTAGDESRYAPAANLSEKFERLASTDTERANAESPAIDPTDLLLVVD